MQQHLTRRILIVLVAGGIALLAARQAFVAAFSTTFPEFAERLMPSDEKATVPQFDRMLLTNPAAKIGPEWQAKAQTILRHNALSSGAIRILGLSAQDPARQRELLRLSERVSRRDLLSQLLLIEDAVQRDDLVEALKHYDQALSVFPALRDKLFGVLAAALNIPEIRFALAPYVRANRPWAYDFVGFATDNAPSPSNVADLLILSDGSHAVPSQKPLETQLLGKLVAKGDIDSANRYVRRMAGSASSAIDRFAFDDKTLDQGLRPFTWSLTDDTRLDVSFNPQEGLDVVAPPGVQGLAANRVMVLSAGRWALAQTVTLPSLSPMASGTWTASCLSKEGVTQIWTQKIPLQPGRQAYRTHFVVPQGCPIVRFELTVQGSDSQLEARISIAGLSLSPA